MPRNPFNALDGDEYYAEELTGLPFTALRKALGAHMPMLLAIPFAGFFRLRGLLNMPMNATSAMGPIGTGRDIEIDDLPLTASKVLLPRIEKLSETGFSIIGCQHDHFIGAKVQYSVLMLDVEETTIATLMWLKQPGPDGLPATEIAGEFNSFVQDGPELLTVITNPDYIAFAPYLMPDFVDAVCLSRELDIEDVFDTHVDRLEGKQVLKITHETARTFHRDCAERRFQNIRDRGIMRKLKPAEIVRIKRRPAI